MQTERRVRPLVAVLVITQDLDEFFELADRFAVISRGELSPTDLTNRIDCDPLSVLGSRLASASRFAKSRLIARSAGWSFVSALLGREGTCVTGCSVSRFSSSIIIDLAKQCGPIERKLLTEPAGADNDTLDARQPGWWFDDQGAAGARSAANGIRVSRAA